MTRFVLATGGLCLALSACSSATDSPPKGDTGRTGGATGGDGGSDGGTEDEIEAVYPGEDQDRVLLYYGSGGFPPEFSKGSFTEFDAHILDVFGWNTDHRSEWTADLSEYRMVGLVAPGHTGEAFLEPDQLNDLRSALENGTRIVFFADRESCGSTVMANTLTELGATVFFPGEAADQNMRINATDLGSHQVTAGLSTIVFKEPCWVDATGGTRVVAHADRVLVAVQRPRTGGDIVIVGDFQALDDSGYLTEEGADNRGFAEQLVKVDPAL